MKRGGETNDSGEEGQRGLERRSECQRQTRVGVHSRATSTLQHIAVPSPRCALRSPSGTMLWKAPRSSSSSSRGAGAARRGLPCWRAAASQSAPDPLMCSVIRGCTDWMRIRHPAPTVAQTCKDKNKIKKQGPVSPLDYVSELHFPQMTPLSPATSSFQNSASAQSLQTYNQQNAI